jgi:hypothetical protein
MRDRLHVRVERLRIENTDCRGFFNYQFNGSVFLTNFPRDTAFQF